MRVGFLLGGQNKFHPGPQPMRPGSSSKASVKTWGTASAADDGELTLRVEEIFRAATVSKAIVFLGRPLGLVPARGAEIFFTTPSFTGHHVYIGGHRGDQIGIFLSAEGDTRPIRRPGKLSDAEFVAFGQNASALRRVRFRRESRWSKDGSSDSRRERRNIRRIFLCGL